MWEYQRTVLGYHGCDARVAKQLFSKNSRGLKPSENIYDWLGKGIYFWEHGPERAKEWATEISHGARSKIGRPVTVGAVIQLGRCFDLLDRRYTEMLGQLYPALERNFITLGLPLPENKGIAQERVDLVRRELDCAMLNWAIPQIERQTGGTFQTVRGAFLEGGPAFPNSKIQRKAHIQIAVRDPSCILGYFKPAT